ncbi:MAG: hypothetical protein IJZ89_01295 [Clostridia bacterium]|nr:hypothetical protein [Clostridia bacterium]
MKKKDNDFVSEVDFRELTPKIHIGDKIIDPLYEKAFLSIETESNSEFNENTTTWD